MRQSLLVRRPLLATILSVSAMAPCLAQENESLFGVQSASVTYGPYVRLEFGSAMPSLGDAYWLPPGQDDPRIDFSASGSDAGFGAVAFGFDWQTGIRADLSFFGMGTSDILAPLARELPTGRIVRSTPTSKMLRFQQRERWPTFSISLLRLVARIPSSSRLSSRGSVLLAMSSENGRVKI